jgi:hypothetical protein
MLVVDLYENNNKLDFHESIINLFDIYDCRFSLREFVNEIITLFQVQYVRIKIYDSIDESCDLDTDDYTNFFYDTKNKIMYRTETLIFTDNLGFDYINRDIGNKACCDLLSPIDNSFKVEIYSQSCYNSDTMKLYIATSTDIFAIIIGTNATGVELKKAIQNKRDILMYLHQMCLTYLGNIINDFNLLSDYAITNACTINLTLSTTDESHFVPTSQHNYCTTHLGLSLCCSNETRIPAKYISVDYIYYADNNTDTNKLLQLNLIIHPKCEIQYIKYLIEIETNLNWFYENQYQLTEYFIQMLSTHALDRYKQYHNYE